MSHSATIDLLWHWSSKPILIIERTITDTIHLRVTLLPSNRCNVLCLRDSGGGSVTVIGTNLDVVNDPKMTTTIVIRNRTGDLDKRPPIVTVRIEIIIQVILHLFIIDIVHKVQKLSV